MVTEICSIVFMSATLVNLFILWRKHDRLDREMYTMFINYSKALESVKGDVRWVQNTDIASLQHSQEETDKKIDELTGKLTAYEENYDELNREIADLRETAAALTERLEEYEAPIEEGSPEASMLHGLQNIFNFSGGVQQ